jgi:hypothetical protein
MRVAGIFNPEQVDLAPYALYVQKQPGSKGSAFSSSVSFPQNYRAVWSYGDNLEASGSSWAIEDKLNIDKFWAVILE